MFLDYHSKGEMIIHPNQTKSKEVDSNPEKIIIPSSIGVYSEKDNKLRKMAEIAAAAMKQASVKNRTYQIGTSESFFGVPVVVGNNQNKIDITQYSNMDAKYKSLG